MIIVSRLVVSLICALGAYQGAAALELERWFAQPWRAIVWAAIVVVGALLGFLIGSVLARLLRSRMRVLERAVDRRSAAELTVGAVGLLVGLLAAVLAGFGVARLPIVGPYLVLPVVLVVAYVFSRIAARKHMDILRLVGLRQRASGPQAIGPRLIDTSAIIDGRIVDVIRTRFLAGSVIVPQFVLEELQRVADSTDPAKRARGRRGLELVEELKVALNGSFSVRDGSYPDADGVDAKLVRMAAELGGAIVTTDFNLNKVASIQGIDVLNLNDLANALKPAVLPGEPLRVRIVREGKEFNQGVGYLDDGTMVVVEGGRSLLGQDVDLEVTSVIQSPSGKMIFSKLAASPAELPSG